MITKKNTLYMALAAAALLSACNHETLIPPGTPVPLQLQVGIGAIESRATAISGTAFARESEICVVLTDYNGSTNNYNTSGIYVYKDPGTGGVWLPSATALQLTQNEAKVLAHYPAILPQGASYNVDNRTFTPVVNLNLAFGNLLDGEYNSDNSFWFSFKEDEPPTEVFMAEGETDYMYGQMTNTEAVTAVNKLAQIQMHHALTMVVFNLHKSNQNPAPCVVKSITVKNTGSGTTPLHQGTFAIPNGTFTASDAVQYIRTMNNFPDNSYFGMMLFPATIGNDEVTVEFKVDDHTYTLPISSCQWQSGHINLYRVQLTPVRAELVDVVKVVDWGTGRDIDFEIN